MNRNSKNINDVAACENVPEKVYIPYDYATYGDINYEEVDTVVVRTVR